MLSEIFSSLLSYNRKFLLDDLKIKEFDLSNLHFSF